MVLAQARRLRARKRSNPFLFAIFSILICAPTGMVLNAISGAKVAGAEPSYVLVDGTQVSETSFCRQATLDHETWGREMSPDLLSYCGL